MNQSEISELVLTGAAHLRLIEENMGALDIIKKKLREEAEQELRKAGIREIHGNNFTFKAADGTIARVSFPNPTLVSQILFVGGAPHYLEDKKLVKMKVDLREVCGVAFRKLFAEYFKPAKAFRELLSALLPKATAAKVLEACELSPKKAKVSFEVAGQASGAGAEIEPS